MQKKILFAVNVDWFFVSHRINLAEAALKEGYEVHLLTSFTKHRSSLEQANIIVHELEFDRGEASFIDTLKSFVQIYKVLKYISPDLVHAITLKMSIMCSIASFPLRIKGIILAISGMGYVYTERNIANFLKRVLIAIATKIISLHANLTLIFQNETDKNDFCKSTKRLIDKSTIIQGSGVDLEKFQAIESVKSFKVKKVAFASRLLLTKGILDYIDSIRTFNLHHDDFISTTQFIVAGDLDPSNPASLNSDIIDSWSDIPNLEVIGHIENLNELFAESYIFILPSYREGFPQVACQAAASGLPVVTTDIPGCRDTIIDMETGILVPPKDSDALYLAIKNLILNEALRSRMSEKAAIFARKNFDSQLITDQHLEIYSNLLNK
jgi:glycosyltransferase involved in cell wall biosynthesis